MQFYNKRNREKRKKSLAIGRKKIIIQSVQRENFYLLQTMKRDLSSKEKKLAENAVDRFNEWDGLGKNTKYLDDWKTLQIRIGDALRVQFKVTDDGEKEIVDIFKKDNHKSHR